MAKVLTNRLKKLKNKLVNVAQNAFVAGRLILDASLIANEVEDSLKKKGKGHPLQTRYRKGVYTVNWNFLLMVLQNMGFG